MAKRGATNQLTHENWDDDDAEEEEAGQCQFASPAALQNRVIRKAKRSSKDTSDEDSVKSPFRGFSGFVKAASKPFTWNSPEVSEVFKKRKQNGCGEVQTSKSATDSNSKMTNAKKMCPSEDSKVESKDLDHFRHLQKLNESVLEWMQSHMAKNPYCDFTPVFNDYKNHLAKLEHQYPLQKQSVHPSSVFKINHENTSFKMPGRGAIKLANFFAKSSTNNASKSGFSKFMKSKSDSSEMDETKTLSDREMSYGAGFNSNTTNTSTFSFGIKAPAHTATSTGSPMGPTTSHSSDKKDGNEEEDDTNEKKEEEEEEKKNIPTFKFGLKTNFGSSPFGKSDSKVPETESFRFSSQTTDPKTFSFGAPPSTSSASAKEDDEYVPPKNEISLVVEDDALYSKRCKLFFKKGDTYVEKGVGTLYLKSLDGNTQLLIRADTNLGNILLNIRLSTSIPLQRTGKNNVLIVCVPNPCLDPKNPDSKEAIPMLLRVKTSDDADELLEALSKHKS